MCVCAIMMCIIMMGYNGWFVMVWSNQLCGCVLVYFIDHTLFVNSKALSIFIYEICIIVILLLLLLLDDVKLSKVNQGMIKESLSSLIILLLEAARTDTDSTGLRY